MRTAFQILAVALLIAQPAAADDEGSGKGAPKVQQVEEVERGLWLRADLGVAMTVLDPFGADRESGPWPPGPLLQLELGYDLGQVASIHLALNGQQVIGQQQRADSEALSNDVAALALLAGGRFNILTTKRLGWYVKAAVGWMFVSPALAAMDDGLLVHGCTGVEYATWLRHFFIGLEAGAAYDVGNGGLQVLLTPTLKYVF